MKKTNAMKPARTYAAAALAAAAMLGLSACLQESINPAVTEGAGAETAGVEIPASPAGIADPIEGVKGDGPERQGYLYGKSGVGAWSAWNAVPGFTAGYDAQVGAVARSSTAVEIHIAAAGQVYTNSWASVGGWQGWSMLPSNL